MCVFLRLSSTQESLESSLIEKDNALAKTSEKLELISGLRESLGAKEAECREASDKLLQAERAVRARAPSLRCYLVSCMLLLMLLWFFFLLPAAPGRFQ